MNTSLRPNSKIKAKSSDKFSVNSQQMKNYQYINTNSSTLKFQSNYSQSLPQLPNNRLPPIQSAVGRERKKLEPLVDPMNIRVDDQLPASYNYFSTPQNV